MPRTKDDLSESIQDYLKVIYELTAYGEAATTNLIAERMDISAASVTVMVQRLARMQPALVDYQKHHGVQLTEEGRKEALQVIRRHRLIEQFLVETLGYSWDEVHNEAERLEHTASEKFVERLAKVLGHPEFDPHGDPIPDKDLMLPATKNEPLSQLNNQERAVVRRVLSSEAGLLHYLGGLGVQPGAIVEVINRVPYDRTVQVRVEGIAGEPVFGPELSELIEVEKIPV